MTSLRKTMTKFVPRRNLYHSKGFDKSCKKIYVSLSFSHYVKRYEHLCQILALDAISAHQIWSCHVTQVANFARFYFGIVLH